MDDDELLREEEPEEEPEEEQTSRRYLRHYKDEDIMRQECDDFVMAGKRLPKLHSRWLFNRYINLYTPMAGNIKEHNRMVDELQEAYSTIFKLRRRIEELEGKQP